MRRVIDTISFLIPERQQLFFAAQAKPLPLKLKIITRAVSRCSDVKRYFAAQSLNNRPFDVVSIVGKLFPNVDERDQHSKNEDACYETVLQIYAHHCRRNDNDNNESKTHHNQQKPVNLLLCLQNGNLILCHTLFLIHTQITLSKPKGISQSFVMVCHNRLIPFNKPKHPYVIDIIQLREDAVIHAFLPTPHAADRQVEDEILRRIG